MVECHLAYVWTWKDARDISVKCKWQNTMYPMSQVKVVCILYVCRTKDLERYAPTLFNVVSLEGGWGVGPRGALQEPFTFYFFHFVLFEFL